MWGWEWELAAFVCASLTHINMSINITFNVLRLKGIVKKSGTSTLELTAQVGRQALLQELL